MYDSTFYIIILLVSLAVIGILVFVLKPVDKEHKISPLSSLAFGFILTGILFNKNRVFGYSLIFIGVVFAILDIIRNRSNKPG